MFAACFAHSGRYWLHTWTLLATHSGRDSLHGEDATGYTPLRSKDATRYTAQKRFTDFDFGGVENSIGRIIITRRDGNSFGSESASGLYFEIGESKSFAQPLR